MAGVHCRRNGSFERDIISANDVFGRRVIAVMAVEVCMASVFRTEGYPAHIGFTLERMRYLVLCHSEDISIAIRR